MQKRFRAALVWLFLPGFFVLAFAAGARAQVFESVGVRAQGMGGAFVAVADDATASWWNPAGLANGPSLSSNLEASFRTHVEGSSARVFAFGFPALALSYYRLALSGIIARPPAGTSPESREDERALRLFGATVGQSIGNHLVVASTVKILNGLDETKGDLDVGAMAAFGPIRLGLTWKNVTKPTFSSNSGELTLPHQARVGVAFRSGPVERPTAIVAIDADLTRTLTILGEERHVAVGTEVWAPSRRVGLRAGLGLNTTGEVRPTGSLGASVALRTGLYADFQGTRGKDDIRNSWGLGLRVTL